MGRTKGAKCLTAGQKAEIIRRVIAGEKPTAIANGMKIGQNTVYRVCRRKGGSIRTLLYGSAI